jgi:hypothetical protein
MSKSWYGIKGEKLEDVVSFGIEIPGHFNLNYLVWAEDKQEAFRVYFTKRLDKLTKELTRTQILLQEGH